MKSKFDKIFLLLFIFLISTFQSSAQQEFKKFAGNYITGHNYGGGSIKLETDGTFSDGGGSDDGTRITSSGNYSFSNGYLNFKYTKQTGIRAGDEKELDLLNPEEKKEMDNGIDSGGVQKEYKLLPIEWSGRIYLIYEDKLKNFVNAINLGIEPRRTLRSMDDSSPWFGSFYLREGDEQKKVTGNPNLSQEWLSFLLSKPITTKIIAIEQIKKSESWTLNEVTINKGSKDGLKVGMQLVAKDEVPSQWSGRNIISVESKTAKLQIRIYKSEKLQVGDKLSTKYIPKSFY